MLLFANSESTSIFSGFIEEPLKEILTTKTENRYLVFAKHGLATSLEILSATK